MISRQLNATVKIDEADSAAMREELQKITRMLDNITDFEEYRRSYYSCEN